MSFQQAFDVLSTVCKAYDSLTMYLRSNCIVINEGEDGPSEKRGCFLSSLSRHSATRLGSSFGPILVHSHLSLAPRNLIA